MESCVLRHKNAGNKDNGKQTGVFVNPEIEWDGLQAAIVHIS